MKYEMIFGDDDFSGQNNDMAEVKLWHDCFGPKFVSIEELHCMNSGGGLPHGTVVLAMRRIIKEPKRWTWEDKKAGRLPEVGCSVVFVNDEDLIAPDNTIYPENGVEVEIVGKTKTSDGRWDVVVFKWLHEDGSSQRYASSGYCSDFNPIETPAEKAQREEDEFVDGESFFVDVCTVSSQMKEAYKQGLRAAYRKLKGGE